MDWSQWFMITALAAACLIGKPSPLVWVVMWANVVVTIILHRDPGDVATADLIAFVVLVGHANTVAALFIIMQPVYVLGHYLGLNEATIYTMVDVLALCQFAVIGGVDAGLGNLLRRARRHLRGGGSSLGLGGNTSHSVGENVSVFSADSRRQ